MRLALNDLACEEERKKVYLLPVKILKTFGKVENAERLLEKKKYYQINISDADTADLYNRDQPEKAGILLDFGRELHGGVRILCSSTDCGYTQVLIRFGESASEALTPVGVKGSGNDHASREFIIPMQGMSDQTWGETGFRFVFIQPQDENAVLSLKSVLAAFTYRDLDYLGSFKCDNELINRIFDVSAYTCHLCLQNYLWDGIKRDRLVWLGDSHPEMLTTQTVFGRLDIFERSIDQARDSYPLPQWINGMPSYSLWWMIIVHDQYAYTGDENYLTDNASYLTGITKQVTGCVTEDGDLIFPSYFIDWPNHGTPAEKEGVKALCTIALGKAASLLRLLGNASLAAVAENTREKLLRAGADCTGSKSTEAMAFLAGLDTPENTADVLLKGGAKGVSTFFSYYILKAIFDSGKKKEALDILREYYGGMLAMGATSFWEDFNVEWMPGSAPIDRIPAEGEKDIHGDFGAFCYKNLRHSLCHGWSSGPAPFLIKHVLGINVTTENGKTKVTVSPCLAGLQFAEGSCALPDGNAVYVKAVNENGKLQVEYTAPEGVEVTVR